MQVNQDAFRTTRIVLIFLLTILLSGSLQAVSEISLIKPATIKRIDHPGTILIPKAKSWLVPLLLPYLQRDTRDNKLPAMLVLPDTFAANFQRYLSDHEELPFLSLIDPETLERTYRVEFSKLVFFKPADQPFEVALDLLRAHAGESPPIVLTSMSDPADFIRAALFSAHFSIPLVPVRNTINTAQVKSLGREIRPEKLYLIGSPGSEKKLRMLNVPLVPLTADLVDRYLVTKIGPDVIGNLIVANPDPGDQSGQHLDANPVFYASYISLLRNAPLVLLNSNSGRVAEKTTRMFISEHGIQPNTITLLGDYDMIRTITADQKLQEQIYKKEMELEPFSNPDEGEAIPFGVGRLPFHKIDCLSLYYTRLAILNKKLSLQSPRFTMIANLASERRKKLMLAESISRATVKELRNFRLNGHEFYGISPQNRSIWETALRSDLIIYEGHIEEFTMISKGDAPDTDQDHYTVPYFEHFPFLVLQSCESLKSHEILLDSGVSGMIGSCSKLHSASGSAFIKAFLDTLLYDRTNNGEALRDAKNYSLGIVKLKEARGHKEQDKTLRSALTFRLMGDPESRLFGSKLPGPAKKPVTAKIVSGNRVEISTPYCTYPKISNQDFTIRHFPRSETAGIVTRVSNKPDSVRRINTFYFFRLPFPDIGADQTGKRYTVLDSSLRTVSLKDPFGRWLYLLHYPQKELRNRKIKISLQRP